MNFSHAEGPPCPSVLMRVCALAIALMGLCGGHADTLVLENGDRLHGTLVSQDAEEIVFESPVLGRLVVPAERGFIESGPAEGVVMEADDVDTPELVEADTDVFEPEPSLQNFWNFALPDGWRAELAVGLSKEDATVSSSEVNLDSRVDWERTERNRFKWEGYYDYRTRNRQKSTDQWGASQDVRQDFNERWFVRSKTSNDTDLIKEIKWDVQQTIGIGYKLFNLESVRLNIVPGIGVRHLEQPDPPGNQSYFTANFYQDFEYILNEHLKLFQDFNYVSEFRESDNYTYVLTAGAETKMNDHLRLRLSYLYDFDNRVARNVDKSQSEINAQMVVQF